MLRALLCSLLGGQNCIIQHLVLSHPVGGRPVRNGRPPTGCDEVYNKFFIKQEFVFFIYLSI